MIDMEKFPVLKSLNRFIITFFFVMGVTFNMVAPFSVVHASDEYGSVVTGCQVYGGVSEFKIDQDVYGGRSTYSVYKYYALFKRSSDVKYNNTCGDTYGSTSNINLLGETVFYKAMGYYNFTSDDYNALYDYGEMPVDSVDYLLGYLVNNGFDTSYLTYLSSDSSILSWTTGNNPYTMTANNDVYIVGASGGYVYYLSLFPDTVVTHVRGNTFTTNLNQTIVYGDTTVYYGYHTNWSYSTSYTYGFNWYKNSKQSVYPYAGLVAFSGGGSDHIDYGSIKDLSYSTNIVGSGTTTGDANIDTISWYPYWDTNDNISTTWNMEIQVVPGTWQGGTATDIFSQSYQDFIINESGAMSIYHGTYLNGSFSISWGEVKNKLSILSWADLFQYFDGSYWNKKGWVYRARFQDPDTDYWSEWQTVYTVTSSSGEGVENFIDPSDGTGLPDFYNNAVNSYNTTSIVNNNNNVTYYYVNTPVDTNPSSDDSTQYLKEIRDTIIQIRKMIAIDNNSDTNINNDNDPWHGNPAAELYDFEDSSINDFNDAVGNLPTSDLVTGNKFLAASTWVRTQYENLVSNTPIEAVIIFSLLLGFGLLLIGKLR